MWWMKPEPPCAWYLKVILKTSILSKSDNWQCLTLVTGYILLKTFLSLWYFNWDNISPHGGFWYSSGFQTCSQLFFFILFSWFSTNHTFYSSALQWRNGPLSASLKSQTAAVVQLLQLNVHWCKTASSRPWHTSASSNHFNICT